ncbi:GGDEF domain-containing protein [Marinomonas sp.]
MDSNEPQTVSRVREQPSIKSILDLRQFLYVGLSDGAKSEGSRRVFMINLFSLVGLIFTLPLGLSSLFNGRLFLGVCLVSVAVIYGCNHLLLRFTHNHQLSGGLIIYPLYGLMLGLFYFGGIEGTGHLWVYCVPAVALFVNGLKKGLIEIAVFTAALAGMMYLSRFGFQAYEYSDALKLRVLLSFLVVVFLSGIYEYSMTVYNEALKSTSKKLEHLAETDMLTGLLNRRGLLKQLAVCDGVGRHLLLVDVDYFKRVNDSLGHGVGDVVLQELAKVIQELEWSACAAARWGGEEFLISVGGVTTDQAYEMAEVLRRSVEAHRFVSERKNLHLTISIGVASMDRETPLEMALKLADNGLYQAKESGRNQTVIGKI